MDWRTILISIGSATVTTLIIEYFAKPRLEARKEMILERARARRMLWSTLTEIYSHLGYFARPPKQEPTEYDRNRREQLRRRVAELVQQYIALRSGFIDASRFEIRLERWVAYFLTSTDLTDDKTHFDTAHKVIGLYRSLMTVSWWELRRRYRLVKEAHHWLEEQERQA